MSEMDQSAQEKVQADLIENSLHLKAYSVVTLIPDVVAVFNKPDENCEVKASCLISVVRVRGGVIEDVTQIYGSGRFRTFDSTSAINGVPVWPFMFESQYGMNIKINVGLKRSFANISIARNTSEWHGIFCR